MSDNTADATILILRDIQARLGRVETKVDAMEADIGSLRHEMRERFDNLIAIFGGAYRDHERRLGYVEARIDRLDPPPPPRRRR